MRVTPSRRVVFSGRRGDTFFREDNISHCLLRGTKNGPNQPYYLGELERLAQKGHIPIGARTDISLGHIAAVTGLANELINNLLNFGIANGDDRMRATRLNCPKSYASNRPDACVDCGCWR